MTWICFITILNYIIFPLFATIFFKYFVCVLYFCSGLCAAAGHSICTPESGIFWAAEQNTSKSIVFPLKSKTTGSEATEFVWTFNFSHECTLFLDKIDVAYFGACTFQIHSTDYSGVGLKDTSALRSSSLKVTSVDVNERTAKMMSKPWETKNGSRHFTITAKASESDVCNVTWLLLYTEGKYQWISEDCIGE